jgi:hypothetical protein
MRKNLFIMLFLSIQTCVFSNGYATILCYNPDTTKNVDSKIEDLLIRKLYSIKELKNSLEHLKQIVGPDASLTSIVSARPTSNFPNYIIEVGDINKFRFENYYTFEIDKKYIDSTNFIYHLKILDDDGNYILLIKWRRNHNN